MNVDYVNHVGSLNPSHLGRVSLSIHYLMHSALPHPSAYKLNDSVVSEVHLSLCCNLGQRSCCYPFHRAFLSKPIPRSFLHANSGVICIAKNKLHFWRQNRSLNRFSHSYSKDKQIICTIVFLSLRLHSEHRCCNFCCSAQLNLLQLQPLSSATLCTGSKRAGKSRTLPPTG